MNTFLGFLPANVVCFAMEGISASFTALTNDINAFFALFGITLPTFSVASLFSFFLSCGSNLIVN